MFCSFKFQICWLKVVAVLYSIFVVDVVCSWALNYFLDIWCVSVGHFNGVPVDDWV